VVTKLAHPLLLAAGVTAGVAACGSGGSGASGPSVTCTSGMIIANEANDYHFTSQLTLEPVTVQPMSNLKFDWSALTKDFQGHALNPATDVNTAVVTLWDLKLADLEDALNTDNLFTSDLIESPPPNYSTNGVTSAMLYDFAAPGETLTPAQFNAYFDASKYTPANSSFLFIVQSGTDIGRNMRMMQAFDLDANSQNTTIALTNASTMLQYTADLLSLHPTGVPAATAALTLDWGQLTTSALGRPFDPTQITSAIVGHYTQTRQQLQEQFLDLETITTEFYRAATPSGTVLDFTKLVKDGDGSPFPGVSADGTWLVGLICGNCRNPAPWYMTILVPAAQPCAN
jgi:hypothetical protein